MIYFSPILKIRDIDESTARKSVTRSKSRVSAFHRFFLCSHYNQLFTASKMICWPLLGDAGWRRKLVG